MKKTPEQVLGRFLANEDGVFYQDGDFYFDARRIINVMSRNGFRIVPRRKKSSAQGPSAGGKT